MNDVNSSMTLRSVNLRLGSFVFGILDFRKLGTVILEQTCDLVKYARMSLDFLELVFAVMLDLIYQNTAANSNIFQNHR